MNNAIIPQTKRRPGRPRKTVNISSFNKLTTYTPRGPKRRVNASDDVEIIDQNGFNASSKKPRLDDGQPLRTLPPRRARYTESYDGEGADMVVVSDEESSSEDSDSSEECGPIPSPPCKLRTPEEQRLWEENIQNLKKELSDEEMKLVLLRKLQESQKSKDPRRETAGSPSPAALRAAAAATSITLKGGVQIQPMPSKQLLANNKYTSVKKDVKQEIPNSRSIPKSSTTFKPIQPSLKSVSNSPIALTVPKSAEPVNNHHLNQYPLLKNLSNQITITAVPPTQANPSPSINKHEEKLDSETLAQRQAAAKLALRKQLEKTLLQIPLPKPPPLKINFFPNANSMEFLCLLGLDFVVDCLTKSKKNSTSKVPLTCAQCSTDFTCTWKWKEVDRNGKKAYDAYCEACITSNIRKGLKAQHTSNLKSAFLKALQQEKEIDRLTHLPPPPAPKSHARESPSASAVSQSSQQQHHHHHHHHHQQQQQQQQSRNRVPTPAHQGNTSGSIPKAMPYIPKAPMPQGLNHAAALAQLSKLGPQYQSLLHAQQLLAGVQLHPGMLSLSPFMTQPPSRGHKSAGQGDGRRQRYRSDRVQSPSIPQSSSSWKA